MSSLRRRYAANRRKKSTGSANLGEPVFVLVGILRRPHGLKGEVLVSLETDFPERLQVGTRLLLGEDHQPVTIASRRGHNDGLLLTFEEYPSIESMQGFRNLELSVPVAGRPPLPDGQYYHHQMLGMQVYEESNELLGTLADILHTGGNDVLVVRSQEGNEILLPAIHDVIRGVQIDEKRMVVHLLPGLREANKPPSA